ncbi:hypothetical protein PsorP6_005769 [Peronosclerospora sorghi]|uniref:Uncharacterized protein n=1 Tax=Peronosclerospora sorghi TaxID=230839 RepID=A0ACC0W7C1_9STRA|nr:hypothetical protein PsorP6_005769 [Peronosclerospora sorghi]
MDVEADGNPPYDLCYAERDERNNAGSIAPPVLPAQLVKLRTGTFISDVLDKYRDHIGLYWSAEDVEQVEADHRGK